ncbi:MAG: hypothetical protein R3E77_04700 [Steroidobacteraceae bacterium]
MDRPPSPSDDNRPAEHAELGRVGRSIGVIIWCAFLAASLATMLCFAAIDPENIAAGELPAWWTDRLTVYAVGFFFFWLIALVASALTLYLANTEHRDSP